MTKHTIRQTATGALALLLSITAVACSDAPMAPSAATSAATLAPTSAPARAVYTVGDTTIATFVYSPLAALSQGFAGGHQLTMPAGAVCDPLTAGYGVGTWDQGCLPLLTPIVFTARSWTDAAGRPHLTFSPDVRFVPGKTVTLRLKDRTASITEGSAIVWCPTGQAKCVDESLSDAALTTLRDPNGMFVYRRLKHFSGYNVVVDRSGDGEGGSDDGTGFGSGGL
jgi:hypothetical protein